MNHEDPEIKAEAERKFDVISQKIVQICERTFCRGDEIILVGIDGGRPNGTRDHGTWFFVIKIGEDLYRACVSVKYISSKWLTHPASYQTWERALGGADAATNVGYHLFPRFASFHTMGEKYGWPDLPGEIDNDVNRFLGTIGVTNLFSVSNLAMAMLRVP